MIKGDITQKFFATVENKLHLAITCQTAAELISSRVDSKKENMGLTTSKQRISRKIIRQDSETTRNRNKAT